MFAFQNLILCTGTLIIKFACTPFMLAWKTIVAADDTDDTDADDTDDTDADNTIIYLILINICHHIRSPLYFLQGKAKDKDGVNYHDIHAILVKKSVKFCLASTR